MNRDRESLDLLAVLVSWAAAAGFAAFALLIFLAPRAVAAIAAPWEPFLLR